MTNREPFFLLRIFFLTSLSCLIFLSHLASPKRADAVLGEDLGVSPEAMSLGNAVAADPPGIYSIHFNPAGLTRLEGTQAQASVLSPWFKHEVKFSAPRNFGVFNFTDDPVKNRTSRTSRAALQIPFTDQMISAPQGLPVPASGGISYSPPNSSLTFATAIYPQLAGGIDRSTKNDPARFGGQKAGGSRFTYFSPSIGYEFSDRLSFGASIGLSYVGIAAQSKLRAPNPIVGLARTIDEDICPTLEGTGAFGLWIFGAGCRGLGLGPFESAGEIKLSLDDSVVPHYNLGMLWEPSDWFALGVTYRSKAKLQLSGDYEIDYSEDFEELIDGLNTGPIFRIVFRALQLPQQSSDVQEGRVNAEVTFPDHIKVGTKIKPTSNTQINLDWGWTNWDELDTVKVKFDRPNDLLRFGRLLTGQGLTQLNLPRGYKSEGYWGVGFTYDFMDFYQLRLGYEDRQSSIPEDKIGLFGPLPDAQLYGAGLGYQWSRSLYLDFSLSHLRAVTDVPAGTSSNLNQTGVGNIIYNPYAGLDVGFETVATIGSVTMNYKF